MSSIMNSKNFNTCLRQFIFSTFSRDISLYLLSTLIELNFTLDDGSAESEELMHITDLTADYREYLSDFLTKYLHQEHNLNAKFICLRTVAFYGMLMNGNNPHLLTRMRTVTWPVW